MKRLFVLPMLLLFSSCNVEERTTNIQHLRPLSAQNITMANVHSIIKDIEQIELEVDSICQIQFIKKIVIAPNKDFILQDKDRIHQFSTNGDFIRTIDRIGRSRNEYQSLADICVDYKNNTLLVLDGMSKVLFFDLSNGNFLRTIKIMDRDRSIRVDGIIPDDDGGFYVISCNMNNKDNEASVPTLYRFSTKGEIVDRLIDVEDCMITMSLSSQSYDNSYLLRPFDSKNIIHKISDGKLTPHYYIDFDGQGVKDDAIYGEDGNMDLRGYFGSSKYKYPSMIQETSEYISFLVAGPEFSAITYLLCKRDNMGYKFTASDKRTTPIVAKVSDDDYFYYLYSIYSDEELEMRADPLTKCFVDKFGVLDKSDNPSIIRVTYL